MVLYPKKGISTIQKSQMTAADGSNTCVIGVESDFDFCQSSIKTIFNDLPFSKKLMDSHNVKLSAANSLNWGRLLPQVVYHASAYLDLVKSGVISVGEAADLCVPTGNFGNILGAYYAKVRFVEPKTKFRDIIYGHSAFYRFLLKKISTKTRITALANDKNRSLNQISQSTQSKRKSQVLSTEKRVRGTTIVIVLAFVSDWLRICVSFISYFLILILDQVIDGFLLFSFFCYQLGTEKGLALFSSMTSVVM